MGQSVFGTCTKIDITDHLKRTELKLRRLSTTEKQEDKTRQLKAINGDLFYPTNTWPTEILKEFSERTITDRGSFKLLMFYIGNGGSPHTISEWILTAQPTNKIKKRSLQIHWVLTNYAMKRHIWYYFDIFHKKILHLDGKFKQNIQNKHSTDPTDLLTPNDKDKNTKTSTHLDHSQNTIPPFNKTTMDIIHNGKTITIPKPSFPNFTRPPLPPLPISFTKPPFLPKYPNDPIDLTHEWYSDLLIQTPTTHLPTNSKKTFLTDPTITAISHTKPPSPGISTFEPLLENSSTIPPPLETLPIIKPLQTTSHKIDRLPKDNIRSIKRKRIPIYPTDTDLMTTTNASNLNSLKEIRGKLYPKMFIKPTFLQQSKNENGPSTWRLTMAATPQTSIYNLTSIQNHPIVNSQPLHQNRLVYTTKTPKITQTITNLGLLQKPYKTKKPTALTIQTTLNTKTDLPWETLPSIPNQDPLTLIPTGTPLLIARLQSPKNANFPETTQTFSQTTSQIMTSTKPSSKFKTPWKH